MKKTCHGKETAVFFKDLVNFEIPVYWGIGKSVSRGFGTVVKMGNEK